MAGRGGTAAAEKAEEEDDSSGSPSSCSEDSGAGSIDAAGLGEEESMECLGRREKGLSRRHGEPQKTKGNGERETRRA